MQNYFDIHTLKVKIMRFRDGKFTKEDQILYNSSPHKAKTGSFDITNEAEHKNQHTTLFSEDTVYNLKEKIYMQTGFLPFQQHLYNTIPIYYEISTEGTKVKIDINHHEPDMSLFQNKNSLSIANYEFSTFVKDLGFDEINVAIIDDFLDGVKGKDDYEITLFYYGFVLKFFPMFSLPVFKKYLAGDLASIKAEFPLLFVAETRTVKEDHILEKMYEIMQSKNKDFQKFYPEYVLNKHPTHSVNISVKITNIMLDVFPLQLDELSRISLDLYHLFTNIIIDDEIVLVKYVMPEKNLIKFKNYDILKSFTVYEKYTSENLSIIIRLKSRDQTYNPYLLLNINKYGHYSIAISLNTNNLIVKNIAIALQQTVNPYIEKINSLGRAVFSSIKRLPLLSKDNFKYKNLDISITWFKNVSVNEFNNLKEYLHDDVEANLISIVKDDINFIRFMYNKIPLDRSYEPVDNEFEYFTNGAVYEILQREWNMYKMVRVDHVNMNLVFRISTKNVDNFQYFYKYIITTLFKIKDKFRVIESTKKTLKYQDPLLFNFRKFGMTSLYSRKCQKQHQPIIVSDPSKYKNVVKFWNFTSNRPEYYHCPNPKYPYINFQVGVHPNNYCLPCCQKVPQTFGNKKEIFTKCTADYCYNKNKSNETRRYISNYNRIITEGRISMLPPLLKTYFDNTINRAEFIKIKNKKVFIEGKEYYLSKIKRIVKYSKTRKLPVKLLMHDMDTLNLTDSGVSLRTVLDNQKKYAIDYSKIRNSPKEKPIYVYKNAKGEYSIINSIYTFGKALVEKQTEIDAKIVSPKQLTKAADTPHVRAAHEHDGGSVVVCEGCALTNNSVAPMVEEIDNLSSHGETATSVAGDVGERSEANNDGSLCAKHINGRGEQIDSLNFFLYGVAQHTKYVPNIGMYYIALNMLKMNPKEFVQKVSSYLLANESVFFSLISNKLRFYFKNLREFISAFTIILLNQEVEFHANSTFDYWNEFIIEIIEYVFDIKPIVIEHEISTNHFYINEFDIEKSVDFIVIIKIVDRSDMSRIKKQTYYYPIYQIILKNLWKSGEIHQKIFNNQDQIVKILAKLLKVKSKSLNYTIEAFENFRKPDVYYVNNLNICHSVGYDIDKRRIVIPIKYTNNFNNEVVSKDFNIDESNVDFHEWKKFVQAYNLHIVENAELLGLTKASLGSATQDAREKNVFNTAKLLKFTTILTFEKLAIGVANDNYYYYFKPTRVETILEAKKGYQIFDHAPIIHKLLYHPNVINKVIENFLINKSNSHKYSSRIAKILYKKRLYNLFLVAIMDKIDEERNLGKRQKINQLLKQYSVKRPSEYNKLKDSLGKLISEADVEKIFTIVGKNESIDDYVFTFDRATMNKLREIKSKSDMIVILKPILSKVLKEGEIHPTEKINYTFEICHSSTASRSKTTAQKLKTSEQLNREYCDRERLIIKKTDLRKMLDLFYDDLMNPMKREYVLSSSLVKNIQSEMSFLPHEGEIIYIQNSL